MLNTSQGTMLVTGATGLVGSHVVERALREGWRVRAVVRSPQSAQWLSDLGVELVRGDLSDPASLAPTVAGMQVIVHCAAKVGDWGPVEEYRKINVEGLEALLTAAVNSPDLRRMIHISSLGVYSAHDHHGTDETTPPNRLGIDGYTLTKVESEDLVLEYVRSKKLPAVVLRPGFIYGPRDRTILPKLLERLRSGQFAYLGSPQNVMNNTYVGNLVEAIFLAIENESITGEVFNITDGRLVTKAEFIETIARAAQCPVPTKVVPIGIAKGLARVLEMTYKLLGKREAPLLSSARIKFLGLNLDYCIDKARQQLGYNPSLDFTEAMQLTMKALQQS